MCCWLLPLQESAVIKVATTPSCQLKDCKIPRQHDDACSTAWALLQCVKQQVATAAAHLSNNLACCMQQMSHVCSCSMKD